MMKLTKYGHACFTVTKDDATLVVDPGNWSTDTPDLSNVVAVVITHEHADHFDHEQLQKIATHCPDATVFAHESITNAISELPTHSVAVGDTVTVGPFTLSFYGGTHATIYADYPQTANLGVMVNDTLYYPGDSFAVPDKPVQVLALPASAPWMRISESMDFCKAVDASVLVFPTHDAILSDVGKSLADKLLGGISSHYKRLVEPVEIDG